MKIKKYEGCTEQEAILKVKDDLGKDALIMNIKKIQPKGIFKLFRKSTVEVTAAYEEEVEKTDTETLLPFPSSSKSDEKDEKIDDFEDVKDIENEKKESDNIIEKLEKKIDGLKDILGGISNRISDYENDSKKIEAKTCRNKIIQIVYNNLIANEVMPEVVDLLLDGLTETTYISETDLDIAVKQIYEKIIYKLGKPKPIIIGEMSKPIVIMGPTGVGKTTTIAKLSSLFILKEQKAVGLITADTYRIAAIEQLKTYADILGIEVKVVYSPDNINDIVKSLEYNDIIFLDTAGCSYKNSEHMNELTMFLNNVGNCDKYLVLSMTTKLSDLEEIIKTYSKITDYNIILTKYDETAKKGVILNVAHLSAKPISYITTGQNVPDDIELLRPNQIAKLLLGSIDE